MKLYFDSPESMTLELSRCPAKEDLKMVISEAETIRHVKDLFVLLSPAVYSENKQLFGELGFSVEGKIRHHLVTRLCRPVRRSQG